MRHRGNVWVKPDESAAEGHENVREGPELYTSGVLLLHTRASQAEAGEDEARRQRSKWGGAVR